MIQTFGDISSNVQVECDVCIIGSGAGGAPMAKELAELGYDVVVLEEGGPVSKDDFTRKPFDMMKTMYRDHGMTAALGLPTIPLPLGRTVGGSTTVNSGTCFRTPEKVLASWEKELGLSGLALENLIPFYERVEEIIGVTVPPLSLIGRNNSIIKEGAEALGLSGGIIPRNIRGCKGSGVCCFGCPTGAKQSTGVSYIPAAVENGARVFANCRAERIKTYRGEVEVVRGHFLEPGTDRPTFSMEVRPKVLVLSCGTIQTPLLMLHNKLGKNLPVGRGLHLHPASKLTGIFDEEIRSWEGIPQSYYIDELIDDGLMMEGAAVPPGLGAMAFPIAGAKHRDVMRNYDRVATFGLLVSDTSAGVVRKGVGGRPLVTYNLNKHDSRRIVRGLKLMAEVFFAAGAKRIYSPIAGAPVIETPKDIVKLEPNRVRGRDIELVSFHPMSTCRMGIDGRTSVADGWGRVHGYKNLFIADGSLLPTSLHVNPQVTIMALSTRTAQYLDDQVLPGASRRLRVVNAS